MLHALGSGRDQIRRGVGVWNPTGIHLKLTGPPPVRQLLFDPVPPFALCEGTMPNSFNTLDKVKRVEATAGIVVEQVNLGHGHLLWGSAEFTSGAIFGKHPEGPGVESNVSALVQEFSIKDLEHFTGIKAHTIRAWEQRYGLLNPRRTSTNIRYYTSEDLKLLLNVSLLNQNGHKISHIAAMGESEMGNALRALETVSDREDHWLGMLKISMLNFDEQLFRSVSKTFEEQSGFSDLLLRLYLPFMGQIGMLWLTNAICPAHEHFVSNLIRQRLFRAVDELPPVDPSYTGSVFALFLPEREIHDISLLMVHYLLRSAGYKSLFLGQSVPLEDLTQLDAQFPELNCVAYCTTYPAENGVVDYFNRVLRESSTTSLRFHYAGRVFNGVESPSERIACHGDGQSLLGSLLNL